MKKSFIISQPHLERLTKDPQLDIVIIGTSKVARDLQSKLRLLNYSVPFLVGEWNDKENGVRHYNCIAGLKPIERYFFIVCADDRRAISNACSAVFKALGIAVPNHPRVMFLRERFPVENHDEALTDAHIHEMFTRKGHSYVLHGTPSEDSFNIHVFGYCSASSIYHFARRTWPERLYEKLCTQGFPAVVIAWGNASLTRSDCLLQFLRDGKRFKADLVLLYGAISVIDQQKRIWNNLLPVNVDASSHPFLQRMWRQYSNSVSNGLSFEINTIDIWKANHRIFCALSRQAGFTFWNIISTNSATLPEEQAQRLTGLSPRYLARSRQLKQDAIAGIDPATVRDYTDSFVGVGDIFDMYVNGRNVADPGHEIIAERCKNDIIRTFGERFKEKRG
jgi:hypothetical protein